MRTPLEIKQMIADLYSHDGTIEQMTEIYNTNDEVKEAIDLFLTDLNKRRVANNLEPVSF